MHLTFARLTRLLTVLIAGLALLDGRHAAAQSTCDPPRMVVEANLQTERRLGLGNPTTPASYGYTRDALFTEAGYWEYQPFGAAMPSVQNQSWVYGKSRWTPSSNGGQIEVQSGVATFHRCCSFARLNVQTRLRFWVKGPPGTRYKFCRTVTARESDSLINPDYPSLCHPGLHLTLLPTATVGLPEYSQSVTSATTQMFDGELYSLAFYDDQIQVMPSTTQAWGCPSNQPNVLSFIQARYAARYEILPPDPVTFVLVIGGEDTTGWLRGDMEAARVASAFNRCASPGPSSNVQIEPAVFRSSDPGSAIISEIYGKIASIRARALPGDTLIVYWMSHGFAAPVGSEPPVDVQHRTTLPVLPFIYRSTGPEYAQFRNFVSPLTHRAGNAVEMGLVLQAAANTDGNLSEHAFADMFRGGVFDCMDKLFIADQCYGGGFWSSLGDLPRTALLSSGDETAFAFSSGRAATPEDPYTYSSFMASDLIASMNELPCPSPGEPINLTDLMLRMLARRRSIANANPTFFHDELWWNEPYWDTPQASYTLVANRSYRSGSFPMCPADVGGVGGSELRDGILDINDFIVFIDYFFNQDPAADLGRTGGVAGADGQFDTNDFIVFIDLFFTGC